LDIQAEPYSSKGLLARCATSCFGVLFSWIYKQDVIPVGDRLFVMRYRVSVLSWIIGGLKECRKMMIFDQKTTFFEAVGVRFGP